MVSLAAIIDRLMKTFVKVNIKQNLCELILSDIW